MKRGRPRKAGPRKPCGRLSPVNDNGTDELVVHRAVAIAPDVVRQAAGIGAEVTMSTGQLIAVGRDLLRNASNDVALAEKRVRSAAKIIRNASGDRRASYVLGVLFATKMITSGQHYAGSRYAGLYQRAVRRVSMPSVIGNLVGGGSVGSISLSHDSPEALKQAAETRKAYLDARKVLDRMGRTAASVVDDVCVFDKTLTPGTLDSLRMGLEVLREHFEAVGRKN